MSQFLLRRLLLTIPVLLGVATLVFSLIHLVPGRSGAGDARRKRVAAGHGAAARAPRARSAAARAVRRLHERRRVRRSGHVAADQPAGDARDRRAPAGDLRAGRRRDDRRRSWSRSRSEFSPRCGRARSSIRPPPTLALVGISMPNFWLGPLLAIVFSVWLGWLPVVGSRHARAISCCRRSRSARRSRPMLARMTRASVIEELRELYVLAARARGVSRTRAVLRHAFRNSLDSDRHGPRSAVRLGADRRGDHGDDLRVARRRPAARSVDQRPRLSAVQGCILLIAVTYVSMNLLVDVAYGFLDPRIRYE